MKTKTTTVLSTIPPQIKSQISAIQVEAREYSITTAKDLEKGADLLHTVKEIKRSLTEVKEGITRPLMQSLAKTRDLFKPLELTYSEAETLIKSKMVAFANEEEERVEREKARVAARVERGTMRADTAMEKLEDIGDGYKGTEGDIGKVQMRTIQKLEITDETLIPREYLEVNRVKVTEALKQGLVVPGATLVETKIIASR